MSFVGLTVALAVFDSLCVIYLYCGSRVLPRNILYICYCHCHASGKEKKGKIPTSETYLSKDSRQTMSKAMLSQMCHWISMLSLCEAFIGLQCRRQHFCLIFTAIILALPYINPLCYFQVDKLHATIVLWLMPFSTSPSLQ